MVEPVVVSPDTDSKNASVKDAKYPEKYKGRAPNTPVVLHAKATKTMPPRVESTILSLYAKKKMHAKRRVMSIGNKKGETRWNSFLYNAVAIGSKKLAATIAKIRKFIFMY